MIENRATKNRLTSPNPRQRPLSRVPSVTLRRIVDIAVQEYGRLGAKDAAADDSRWVCSRESLIRATLSPGDVPGCKPEEDEL